VVVYGFQLAHRQHTVTGLEGIACPLGSPPATAHPVPVTEPPNFAPSTDEVNAQLMPSSMIVCVGELLHMSSG
jgi:hypothetical protein